MPQNSKFWKYFFITSLSLIALIIVFFLSFFIYYSVQLKYGNSLSIQNIASQYEKNFSSSFDKDAPQNVTDYSKLIQKFNPTQGEKNAKITIIAFLDFECPYCQASYNTFKHILEKYQPVTQVIFKNLPLAEIHPNALNAAIADSCAHEQNKFWEYYNALYTNKQLDKDSLYYEAKSLDLDMIKFDTCFTSNKYINNIEKDLEDAVSIGLRGTPTYLINGEILEGDISADEWDKLIIKNLNK